MRVRNFRAKQMNQKMNHHSNRTHDRKSGGRIRRNKLRRIYNNEQTVYKAYFSL